MAYQLEYEFRELKKSSIKKNKSLNYIFAAVILAAAVMGARIGGAALEVIILGRQENVRIAATEMVTHLREGMAFDDAVYAFCEDITNEQIAD